MREEEEFPPKLLDCPVLEHVRWPESFARAGDVLRFDYASRLHARDGSWEKYRHRFSTGVGVWVPEGCDVGDELAAAEALGQRRRMREPYEPVHMGFAQRLYFVSGDGRQSILANPGIGVDPEDAEESFRVIDLPPSSMAWDPEGLRLFAVDEDGEVRFVLMGGLLRLSDDAMLVG